MNYMPFNSEEQPLYADEHENIIFRVKDIKGLIENHTQLPVIKLMSMGSNSDPDKLNVLYGDLKPDRIWFVLATLQTPEGTKTSEILVMLKNRKISLPRRIFLHLEAFLTPNREQAKQDIPDLTLDYIQTLENAASDMWRVWRDLSYYLHAHRSDPSAQQIMNQFKHQMDELYKDMQSLGFLGTSEGNQDPFPTGF